ncbi:MAG TPA: hypothetical protein VFU46_09510 [Gemmatimonadales bacterium]|nr:hypothetical protein [Gemmatimonadales bacterium]
MAPVALEQERLHLAERLLTQIQRRHGLPETHQIQLNPIIVDRYLAAYLPETRDGSPAPRALEYTFTPTLRDAIALLSGVVMESPDGRGAAIYVYDLDTAVPFEPNGRH